MDVVITYDLKDGEPDPHKPFLTAAEKEGLLYVWKGADYVSRLPNTTVWGVFDNLAEANDAFTRALKKAGNAVGYAITLEKRATASMSPTNVMSNERKKPEAKWTGGSVFETSRLHQLNDPKFK